MYDDLNPFNERAWNVKESAGALGFSQRVRVDPSFIPWGGRKVWVQDTCKLCVLCVIPLGLLPLIPSILKNV